MCRSEAALCLPYSQHSLSGTHLAVFVFFFFKNDWFFIFFLFTSWPSCLQRQLIFHSGPSWLQPFTSPHLPRRFQTPYICASIPPAPPLTLLSIRLGLNSHALPVYSAIIFDQTQTSWIHHTCMEEYRSLWCHWASQWKALPLRTAP